MFLQKVVNTIAISFILTLVEGGSIEDLPPATLQAVEAEFKSSAYELAKRINIPGPRSAPHRTAVLPCLGDTADGYFSIQLQNALTQESAGAVELYTRDQNEVQELLKEIEWNQIFEDAFDPTTVQSLGRFRGVESLVFSRHISRRISDRKIAGRLSIRVISVSTKQLLWGDEKSYVIKLPRPPMSPRFQALLIAVVTIFAILVVVAFKGNKSPR